MGLSKELFMEIRIQAEIDEREWNEIPNEYRERFSVKRVEVDKIRGVDAKEVYKRDATWKELHSNMVDALKLQKEREEQIRTEQR